MSRASHGRSRGILDNVNVGQFPGIHLSAAEWDAEIVANGNSGEYRRAILCPCVRIDTRTPAADCPTCKGLGRVYPESLREPCIVLDTQRNATAKLIAAGKMADGTIQLTFPSDIVPAMGDQWVPDEEVHVVTENLFRNGTMRAPEAELRLYRTSVDDVKAALVPRVERLTYPTTCCIEDVSYLDGNGGLIQANPSEYHVEPDGAFVWRRGQGPPSGAAWSVRYRAGAVYVVHTSLPVYRGEADERMPHRVTARRLDRYAYQDLRT